MPVYPSQAQIKAALRATASLPAMTIAAPPTFGEFGNALWSAGRLLGRDPRNLNTVLSRRSSSV